MKICRQILIAVSLLIALSTSAQAAWVATDDFDGYTLSADLNTLNGGSGWSAGWVDGGGGTMTIETAPAGGQGGKAVRSNSATVSTIYHRTVTSAVTAGTVGFRMRVSISNPNDFVGVWLSSTTTGHMYIKFDSDGNIKIFNGTGSTYDTIQAYSVDTWYTIEIDFDDAAQNDLYRARVNGGSYTSYKLVNNTSYASINRFNIEDSATGAHTFWLDDIGLAGTPESGAVRRSQPIFFP